jgi:hypothetical protein
VKITNLPGPLTAGSSACVTVIGATGSGLVAKGEGSVAVTSITAAPGKPGVWVVCFTVGTGLGSLNVESGPDSRSLILRGR